jgi:hypothetical protein
MANNVLHLLRIAYTLVNCLEPLQDGTSDELEAYHNNLDEVYQYCSQIMFYIKEITSTSQQVDGGTSIYDRMHDVDTIPNLTLSIADFAESDFGETSFTKLAAHILLSPNLLCTNHSRILILTPFCMPLMLLGLFCPCSLSDSLVYHFSFLYVWSNSGYVYN